MMHKITVTLTGKKFDPKDVARFQSELARVTGEFLSNTNRGDDTSSVEVIQEADTHPDQPTP